MVDDMRAGQARRSAVWACAVALLVWPLAAMAEDFRCAALQPSRAQQPPYQRLPGQARCEGFFDRNVSQPFVELVSLTRGRPDTATALPAGSLQISALPGQPARLVVHPLRSGPFYRVDALIEPEQPLLWDPAPMLRATGLRLRDLGFLALALTPRDDTMAVLPVSLAPAAMAEPSVQAVLRVSVAVRSMAWRRYRLDGADDSASDWRDIAGPPLYPWDRVALSIELPADGKSRHVDVQARDAEGKSLPLLRFMLVGAD